MNDYQKAKITDAEKIAKELRVLGFNATLDIKREGDFVEYVNVMIGDIVVRYLEYQKQYSFYYNDRNIMYVDYSDMPMLTQDIKAPQNVGVLTAKKVQSWIDYETAIHDKKIELSKKRINEVNTFMNEAKAAGFIFRCTDEYRGYYESSLVKNGIEMSISIQSRGYIHKKIELHYSVRHTIESFKKLSDNQYREVKA